MLTATIILDFRKPVSSAFKWPRYSTRRACEDGRKHKKWTEEELEQFVEEYDRNSGKKWVRNFQDARKLICTQFVQVLQVDLYTEINCRASRKFLTHFFPLFWNSVVLFSNWIVLDLLPSTSCAFFRLHIPARTLSTLGSKRMLETNLVQFL